MLTLENYYYSDAEKKPVTDIHTLHDDETVELEINIRYPVRFKVAELKKQFIENIVSQGELYNTAENRAFTVEEFEANPVIDDQYVFYILFQNMLSQAIGECYDAFTDEEAKAVYDKLKYSEIVSILDDIKRPMKVKRISPHDLQTCSCCGPFPKLKE
jgi:hypothetical protein